MLSKIESKEDLNYKIKAIPATPKKHIEQSKYLVENLVSCPGSDYYCYSDYPICFPPSVGGGCCPTSHPNLVESVCYPLGEKHEPYFPDQYHGNWISCPGQDYYCPDLTPVCSHPSMPVKYQGCCWKDMANHVGTDCCNNRSCWGLLKYPFLYK